MTAKERILSLKLLEAQKKQGLYMNRIGITVALIDAEESKNDCNRIKGVKNYDKNRRN